MLIGDANSQRFWLVGTMCELFILACLVSAFPLNALPDTAFVDPSGNNRAEVEALLSQVMAMVMAEMSGAQGRSPLPSPLSTEQFNQWAKIPEQSVGTDELLMAMRSLIQNAMNAAHPGYIGHMDSMPTTLSVIGDLLSAALNNNMLSVEMSPVFSRLEPLVMRQLAALFNLGPKAGGVMASGGSLANLHALTVARNVAFDAVNKGIVGLQGQPVFFVSEVAHTSMQKAAMMMGLGAEGAIAIRTNAQSQIDIFDLKDNLDRAKKAGQLPFALVATAGTTVTGNIDPIAEMADLADSHNLWFHVDAAYGGALIFSPNHRHLLGSIDRADSVTFNPQKWLYVAKTCATVLFKNFDTLKHHFRIRAPYMGDDNEWTNLGELTVQGTRHSDILKLWLSLQHIGSTGYAAIIQHNYDLTAQFVSAIKARPHLQLASLPQMNLVCFRLAPIQGHQQISEQSKIDDWDALNAQLQQYLLKAKEQSQAVFLSLPTYQSQRWLKAVLLNPYTSPAVIKGLFSRIDAFIKDNLNGQS